MVWRTWLLLVALCLAASGLVAAQAAWRAVATHDASDRAPSPRLAGYEADDHFPGAALIYAQADAAPPPVVPGATGTIALPPLPIPAAAAQALAAAEPSVVPARPFTLVGTSADRARAFRCLADAVYYEAASEPDDGQRAVAQVILNRVRHPAFPPTVCGVVYQGSEARGCQFSFACDGAMARAPARTGWVRAARAAAAALAGYVYAPVGLATHYHTFAVTPAWNRALVMTDVVGAHFFHRWKGYWGTDAAFRQTYAGGEPLPGPHVPVVAPPSAVLLAAEPVAPTVAVNIRAAYADTSVAIAPAPTGDHLPPASTVLAKWKDSGKPL